jgi:hypothetical protein
MFADGMNRPAPIDQSISIEFQGIDCRPTSWRQAHHLREVVTPHEMLIPTMLARMKERNLDFGNGINREYPNGFVLITAEAGTRKIFFRRRTAQFKGDDVVYRKWVRGIFRLGAAIFANIRATYHHQTA